MEEDSMEVREITYQDTKPFILEKHYAGRMPSVSYAFGLFFGDKLEGVLTIGKPASNSLCEGVCGKEYKDKVYELNRLIVNEGLPKNTLSRFVSECLKRLKYHNLIIVSYP
ncbi:acetyltransferase [Bacillus phage PSYJ-YH]|nr:acetyltransferase [Bacillus phage PSYJ-YH]